MGKQRKKMKDPLAPKKPLGPYLEFAQEERPKVLAELGTMSIGEAGKELGRRWKSLSELEKKAYEEKSRDNGKKYAIQMDQYSKMKGHKVAPQKPLSPYLEFAKEERPKVLADHGVLTAAEAGKELGKRWRNMPKNLKERFEEVSKENQKVYEKEMEEFSKKSPESSENMPLPVLDGDLPETSPSIAEESEENPPISPLPETSSAKSDPKPPTSETDMVASDLGFAKQKGYSWHPALKTGTNPRGSRITVTYFGTGQTGIVDKVRWIPFTTQVETRITTPGLLKRIGFRKGIDQLKNMLRRINSGVDKPGLKSGVGFSAQPVGRKLVKLSKDGLQKDEEQNFRLMKEKIVERTGEKYKWECRDCPWKGKFANKAKAHARDCGTRRKENTRKPKSKKYECSSAGCSLSFPFLSQLQKHYR